MDEWEAESDWRDEPSAGRSQVDAPTGLLRATLIGGVAAFALAVFAAPAVKHQAGQFAAKAHAGLDQIVTGSITLTDARDDDAVDAGSSGDAAVCSRAAVARAKPC